MKKINLACLVGHFKHACQIPWSCVHGSLHGSCDAGCLGTETLTGSTLLFHCMLISTGKAADECFMIPQGFGYNYYSKTIQHQIEYTIAS